MSLDTLTILLIISSLILAFAIGAQDETMATVYGSGSLKLRSSVVLGGILAFFGVLFLSNSVGEAIGTNLLGMPTIEKDMIFAILLSTAIWLLVAIKTHLPISTTHSVVGCVFGVAVIWALSPDGGSFFESLNWVQLGLIFLGWFLSPVLGFFGAILMQKVIKQIRKTHNKGILEVEKIEGVFRYLIIFAASLTQISRGGNDAGNAIGIFYGLLQSDQTLAEYTPVYVLISGILFSAGLIIFGKNLVKNVGSQTTGNYRPSEALAISITTSLILFLSTIFGFPVSGGHILVFAMVGYARTRGELPDRKTFRRMVTIWILTFPIAAALSAVIYGILVFF